MNWGFNLGLKKVKKIKESKLDKLDLAYYQQNLENRKIRLRNNTGTFQPLYIRKED